MLASQIPLSPKSAESPASPGRGASARVNYRCDPGTFSDEIQKGKLAVRALVKMAAYVAENNGSVSFTRSPTEASDPLKSDIVVNRAQIKSMLGQICGNMDKWAKQFRASAAKKRVRAEGTEKKPNPTNGLFFISDRLKEYLQNANYGNGLTPLFASNPALAQDLKEQFSKFNGGAEGMPAHFLAQVYGGSEATLVQAAAAVGMKNVSSRNMDVRVALSTLVFDNNMITSRILLTLFSLINYAGDLKSKDNGQRVHFDQTMVNYFYAGNTHFILEGTDFGEAKFAEIRQSIAAQGGQTVSSDEETIALLKQQGYSLSITPESLEKLIRNASPIDNSTDPKAAWDYTAFERIAARPAVKARRKTGTILMPTLVQGNLTPDSDDWGFLYSMYLVLMSYFHIPEDLLPANYRAKLKGNPLGSAETFADIADNLGQYVKNILSAHHEIYGPAKRQVQSERRRAQLRTTGSKKTRAKAAVLPLPLTRQ